MSNIVTQFRVGMVKADDLIKRQLLPEIESMATKLLYDAVQSWSNYNMTGNTINSYAAAIYYKNTMVRFIDAYDVGVTDRPTANYSYPGDRIYVYHQESEIEEDNPIYQYTDERYEVNNWINKIREYSTKSNAKFQELGRGSGPEDAKKLCQDYTPKSTDLFTILIVVGVPYASYLENQRKLDVLTEAYHKAESELKGGDLQVKPL